MGFTVDAEREIRLPRPRAPHPFQQLVWEPCSLACNIELTGEAHWPTDHSAFRACDDLATAFRLRGTNDRQPVAVYLAPRPMQYLRWLGRRVSGARGGGVGSAGWPGGSSVSVIYSGQFLVAGEGQGDLLVSETALNFWGGVDSR